MPRRGGTASLYVRNIPDGSRHEDLRRLFGKYGRLYDVTIPLDYYTGRMKGFAFIEFEDPRDAEDAHYRLDRSRFMGREIEVEFSRGGRKTPSEMRTKDRGGRSDKPRRRSRSRSRGPRSRSRSRSFSRERVRRSPSIKRDRGSRSRSASPMGKPMGGANGRGAYASRSRSRS